ncbi:MAG TPA: response regulator [Candidatus Acidoferrales bacterium]|jgi:DNA-binding NtrC family response regulator|nr:response regulator [Candidatus Acidoferrales bacterium]
MTETMENLASILIVEDDPKQLKLYARALRGYRLTCVSTGTAALKAVRETKPDLIILDNVLDAGERGVDFLPRLKGAAAHVPIIVISGTLKIHEQLAALQGPRSAHFTLDKPVDLDELDRTVEIALTECGFGETIAALQSLEQAEKIESSEPDRRFTDRLARQYEMIKRLRGAAARPNISELSREFNVARKTIIRDLQDLIKRGQLPAEIYPEWNQENANEE